MTDDDLLKQINDIHFLNFCKSLHAKQKIYYFKLMESDYRKIFEELSSRIDSKRPLQILWHIYNKQVTRQLCKCHNCDDPVNWVPILNAYRIHCSPKCRGVDYQNNKIVKVKEPTTVWHKDPVKLVEISEKRRKRSLEKYGVEHHSQRLDVREKTEKTNLDRYGKVSPLMNTDIQEKIKQTLIKKYGVDNPSKSPGSQTQKKQTNLERYGADHPFKNKEIQQRQYKTMTEKWGAPHALQNLDIKEKQQKTNLEKFGHVSPFGSIEIQLKSKKTLISKYGVENNSQKNIDRKILEIINDKELFSDLIRDKTIFAISQELGLATTTIVKRIHHFELDDIVKWNSGSSYEDKIKELLNHLQISYVQHTRSVISPLELDFYLPDHKLAIEVGSAYFHSEISGGKDRKYHYTKWVKCNEQGITLLQYFDNDVLNNWHLIESKIKRLIKQPIPIVGARKLTIRELTDYNLESEFLEAFHLQGAVSKRNLVLSAYYNDNLVGITSWLLNKNTCELVRYATDISNVYPGLFSKMLKNFCRLTKFNGTLISFSDNRHSNGRLYKSMGFTLDSVSNPGYLYTRDFINFESRIVYQKHKLKDKFKLLESDLASSTEWSIMQSQGYDRLWDAGQSKWVMQITG